jgi:hypothetical protein
MVGLIDTINNYLIQSGVDWISLGQAMDYNLVVLGMFITGCAILCLSFYLVDLLLIISVFKKGFFSTEHKRIALWFFLFLFLCGTTFGMQILIVFYPLYWILASLLLISSTASLLTSILYIKYFKRLSAIPSTQEILDLQKENNLLKKKVNLLHEHLDVWSQNVGYHIGILKNQHSKLSEEIHSSASPVQGVEISTNDDVRQKVLDALTKIKEELATLTAVIK